jgi:hypothetical protein
MQPVIALCIRDGKRDAQIEHPEHPLFLSVMAFQGAHWPGFLGGASKST